MTWEQTTSILFLLIISVFVNWIAGQKGYFHIPRSIKRPSFPFPIILLCFIIFFGVTMILFPATFTWLTKLTSAIQLKEAIPKNVIINSSHSIALLASIFVIFLILTSHSRKMLYATLKDLQFEARSSYLFDMGIGILSWIIAFPTVSFIAYLSDALLIVFFHDVGQPQSAIVYLRQMQELPIALVFTIFTIVFLAPLAEELLFRGLLQNWLAQHLGRMKGIILTSIVFALFHFSMSHGVSNFTLLLSLGVFSYYLGHIYERQRSLLSPILLHATFNLISVIRVLIGY